METPAPRPRRSARWRRAAPMAVLALLGLPLVLLAAALAAAAAALQSEPTVVLNADPDTRDVARVLNLLRQHDPRRAAPGVPRGLVVGERDIDVLLNHAAARRLQTATRVSVERGRAVIRASVHLPPQPLAFLGRWLNVELRLLATGGLPAVEAWQVGGLPLPAALALPLLRHAAARAGVQAELALAGDVVRRVDFAPGHVGVVYVWDKNGAERVVAALVPPAEQERLRAYHTRLAELTQRTQPAASLAPLLGPLFELARQRSADAGDDAAAAENRAALVVLTLYAGGRALPSVLPAARDWPRTRPLRLTLAGREDFPLHFLVSAALAAEASGPLSRAIGVYKETADARHGSGFSFTDMAANRAGTRFGEMAVQRPRELQAALAGGVAEDAILPATADLPEFMAEPEFRRRFGGVDQPRYTALMAEIERRVAALPVLR